MYIYIYIKTKSVFEQRLEFVISENLSRFRPKKKNTRLKYILKYFILVLNNSNNNDFIIKFISYSRKAIKNIYKRFIK